MGNKGSKGKEAVVEVPAQTDAVRLTVEVTHDQIVFSIAKDGVEGADKIAFQREVSGTKISTVAELRKFIIDHSHAIPSFTWGDKVAEQLALCLQKRELKGPTSLAGLVTAQEKIAVRVLTANVLLRNSTDEEDTHTIYHFPSDTIVNVKHRAAEKLECPLKDLKLAHCAKLITDDRALISSFPSAGIGQVTFSFTKTEFPEGFLNVEFDTESFEIVGALETKHAPAPTSAPVGVATSTATLLASPPSTAAPAAPAAINDSSGDRAPLLTAPH
ncbi:MAG TPA: hypothetical protein VNC84_02055 [Gammaproteobacteria bacterium]|jgi:hypothetical protein|nr:hypothetical protein [Gammaproteobacteria bacterium]